VHQLAAAKAGCVERPSHAPVVLALRLRLEDRPGRGEHARERASVCSGEAAERRALRLLIDEIRFARQGQRAERRARRHALRVDPLEDGAVGGCIAARMGNLCGQRFEESTLARFGVSGLELVEELRHAGD
jgi:hypothetical protein